MSNTRPAVLVVTGASGSGKTATVRAVEARALPGVRCYYFDSVGVPPLAEMSRDFGSPEGWQATVTQHWLDRFSADADRADVYLLDGQTRPSVVRMAAARSDLARTRIVLLDCAADVRNARLAGPRAQPELGNARMDAWAAYLRGQADALELPIIDTTSLTIAEAADALCRHIEATRRVRL